MRARTIGQIATLIAEHMGGGAGAAKPAAAAPVTAEEAPADDVDLDALSDEDIDQLLGEEAAPDPKQPADETATLKSSDVTR